MRNFNKKTYYSQFWKLKSKRKDGVSWTNKNTNDFWLKNNTKEGQSHLNLVNGKSTVSIIFSCDNFRLQRTLFIVNSQYSSNARILSYFKHEKAPNMKTKKQLSRPDNKEAVFDFSIAVWHFKKSKLVIFDVVCMQKSNGTQSEAIYLQQTWSSYRRIRSSLDVITTK